jgi:hypothetical protein
MPGWLVPLIVCILSSLTHSEETVVIMVVAG